MDAEYLSVDEVALLLGCSKWTIWHRAKKGTFPAPVKKIGTKWRRSEVLAWMAA